MRKAVKQTKKEQVIALLNKEDISDDLISLKTGATIPYIRAIEKSLRKDNKRSK